MLSNSTGSARFSQFLTVLGVTAFCGKNAERRNAGVRGMADLRRKDESRPAAGIEQRSGNNNERDPRGGQTRQLCPEPRAEFQSYVAHGAIELLITNERRVPGNAIEASLHSGCPMEKSAA